MKIIVNIIKQLKNNKKLKIIKIINYNIKVNN